MKSNKNKIYSALTVVTALLAQLPASAQETADSALVNVAFKKVQKTDVLGGVGSINVRELTEKNYNTYSLDNMQGYVAGYNGNGMWGYSNALVLIDGVPREANNVRPDEIEDISFLKGAQASLLYGSRAANGVIMITTKRGHVTEGLKVKVNANTGWNVAKAFPEYLGSAEYMSLYNEAFLNDGGDPNNLPYSPESIYNYASGQNPYRYPSVDFYSSDYIKKAFNRSEVSAEIEGGNQRARFYANISYNRAGDNLNFGAAKKDYTDRFNVRGNVDILLNSFITAYVNANATYYGSKSANNSYKYWELARTFRPNRVAPLIPIDMIAPNAKNALTMIGATNNIIDGKYFLGGTSLDQSNVFGDIYASGTNVYHSRQFQFDAGVNFDLSSVLKGLSFHTMVAIDYATLYTTSFNNTYATFQPTWANFNGKDVIVGLNNNGTVDKKSGVQNISGSTDNQTIAFNAHFDYDRTFNDVHNVSAMLVANGYQQTISGQYHKTSNANMGLQLSYNYDHKYYADFALATPWSAKLPSANRLGLSPSATLGWRLSKEKFMENSFFDDLTLSASYTDLKTDLGIDNYYMYLGVYQNGGWWDWNGGSGHSAVQSKHGENNDFNYLHRKEFSVSLHAEVLDKSLSLDASYFLSKWTNGIIQSRNQMPSYMFSYYPESSFVPYMNYNEDKRTGFDLGVNYKKQIGELGIGVGANLTYYTTKATKRDDSQYADAYQYRQGQPLDAIWGYECEGFFKDQADIDASPKQIIGGTIRPGDLKYKDQNGDNVIDGKDQVCLGKGGWYGTPTTLGVNVTLKYKNFTLFLLGTGNFGAKAVKNSTYYWVGGDAKYTAEMRGRWTPETAATATYPRLTTEAGTNNYQTSDFWMYSTDRFDLQKVQLSYDFPKSVFGKSFIRGLQLFVNGNSLLTIAKERKILEMNVNNKGAAPLNRFYSIGAKVSF